MGALTDPAGKRCGNKSWLEYRIHYLKHCVVKDAIPDARFVNMPQFRITYPEWLVRSMPVGMMLEFPIQPKDFMFKLPLEPCHVGLVPLVSLECFPRRKDSIRPDD
jgi:hypothetical protein